MKFEKIEMKHKPFFDDMMQNGASVTKEYYASELQFANIFCWSVDDNVLCHVTPDAIFLIAYYKGDEFYLPPLAKSDEKFVEAVKFILTESKHCACKIDIRSFTKEMTTLLMENNIGLEYEYVRDYSEYLYITSDVIELKGKKYHAKRNHLNQFQQNYDYSYEVYSKDKEDDVKKLFDLWYEDVNAKASGEKEALYQALQNYEELGLVGGLLYVDGTLIAFSFGFKTFNNIAIILFEKADINYRGSYIAMFNNFIKHNFVDCLYINRQEDMGNEGIRKSKLSYLPCSLVDKFNGKGICDCKRK